MSHLIAGIDESLRPRNYLMCATVVSTNDRTHVRQVLRGLLLPNQRRLHAKTESQGRRRRILKVLSETDGVECHITVGRLRREGGREACLSLLTEHLLSIGVSELILERVDDGTARQDRDLLEGVAEQSAGSFTWRHELPAQEPLLWVSDIVVSAYGAGGGLRQATQRLVKSVSITAPGP